MIPGRSSAVYVGDDTVLTITQLGLKMYVDALDYVVSPHVILDGMWEAWLTQYFMRTLGRGLTFVDVGAHVGWYTLLAAQAVGPTGQVIAFEPNPRLCNMLRKSISINGFTNVALHECGLGDRPMDDVLVIPDTRSGNGRFGVGPTFGETSYQVFVKRLDDLVERADVIKIDAEGYEAKVLQGAQRMLYTGPAPELLVEYHDSIREDLLQLVADGWTVDWIQHDSKTTRLSVEEMGTLADSEMLRFVRR